VFVLKGRKDEERTVRQQVLNRVVLGREFALFARLEQLEQEHVVIVAELEADGNEFRQCKGGDSARDRVLHHAIRGRKTGKVGLTSEINR
jgi:hypothetical protein